MPGLPEKSEDFKFQQYGGTCHFIEPYVHAKSASAKRLDWSSRKERLSFDEVTPSLPGSNNI
jgi:hypothetical protein